MKKIFVTTLVFALILIFLSVKSVRATDVIFGKSSSEMKFIRNAIDSIVCDNYDRCNLNGNDIQIQKEKIYDVYLNKIGHVYSFSSKGEGDIYGYLMTRRNRVDNNWVYEIVEMATGTHSPFNDSSSKNVYVSYGNYLEQKGKMIIDEMNHLEYDYEEFLNLFDMSIFPTSIGSHEVDYHTEYYTYYSYGTTKNMLDAGYPYLSTTIGLSWHNNNCSPTAGTSIIAFWDRDYPNLISGYTPTYSLLHGYPPYNYYYTYHYKNWNNLNAYETPDYSSQLYMLKNVHNTLYNTMYTDDWYIPLFADDMEGTYPPFFVSGLRDYIESKGYEMHTVGIKGTEHVIFNLGSQTAVSWSSYVEQINLDRPILMQLGLDPSLDYEMIKYIEDYRIESYRDIEIEEDTYLTLEYPYQYVVYYDTMSMEYREDINMIHTVVGVGTKTFNYFKLNLYTGEQYLAKTDDFFVIANGWGGLSYIKKDNRDIGVAYSVYVTN